jgi:two-component system chemotaxis sensor kinase CheA
VARDQYKYFRIEGRELLEGLSRGALELEKGGHGPELVAGLLRIAHTLKGAARVVRQKTIAELAHAIEDVLAPHRGKGREAVPREHVDQLLRLIDAISSDLAVIDPAPALAPERPRSTASEPLENVRVEIKEMDALLEGVFETGVRLASLRPAIDDVARASTLAATLVESSPRATRARSAAEELRRVVARAERILRTGLDHAEREIAQVHEKANELRLMPVSAVFAVLERGARDAAQALDKSIDFETSGGDHRIEANVLFALRDALLHVVRNAVAHGIEPERERRSLGKAPVGRVQLDVQRRGHMIAFICGDDGRGVDVEAVRRAAVAHGLATAPEAVAFGPEEVLRLVLESGVTTSEKVTEISGRGIGLDVLRSTVAQLKGEVHVSSQPGRGTTVDVCVPLSISSVFALALDAAGVTASVPLDSVQRTLSLAAGDIARAPEHDSVVVEGVVVPFLPLALALRRPLSPASGTRRWTAVVVAAGSRCAAIGVDRLVGTSSIVVRPLPRLAGPVPIAAGVSLDAEGHPRLVLDPRSLVRMAYAARRGAVAVIDEAARAPVLIVDDSLTTRMLEQSILESAGYAVELATSAEEALAKASRAPYSLFLVDVEMPGMDGFEFVSRARADPALRAIPAILVTSRNTAQDRCRAEEVGARAYIVKGEFDQGYLLRTIRQLIG